MTSPSKNSITGDKLQSKVTTKDYRDNYDRIFGKEDSKCCGKCSPCSGHSSASNGLEIENQKEETNDRQVQESK